MLTHGHEDHIGAVAHVMPLFDGPVYGTAFTLALLEPKLEEHGIEPERLTTIQPRDTITIGPFSIEFIRVTHSMPDCVALAITTPAGIIIHTGDFKIDQTPIDGQHFDLHRFAELGSARACWRSLPTAPTSTARASPAQRSRSSRRSKRSSRARTASSWSPRSRRASTACRCSSTSPVQFERKVAFVGRSMVRNAEIAQRLGYLRVPSGVQIRDADVGNYASQDVLCLATGSQGEPQAALPRIAIDDHRCVKLGPDDTVVLSARAIPGNEKAIARTMSHIARRGADVITDTMKHVHVSGHGSVEELKLMLSLVRPRYFVPVHGEYRQLSQHARMAERVMGGTDRKVQVLLAEDGDIIQFDAHGARIADKAPTGRVLIDVTRTGEVGDEVLRDRRHLAGDGVIVAVVAISRQTGVLVGQPELVARGFVVDERDSESLFADAAGVIADCIESSSVEERTDQGLMTEKLRGELRRFFKKRSGRRPLVLPVLMEI